MPPRSTPLRRGLVLAIATVLVASAAWFLVPRVAGHYARESAARRGLRLSFAEVKLGLRTVSFANVDISIAGAEDVAAHFASLRVTLDAHLHPTALAASGGNLVLNDVEHARSAFDAWRAAHRTQEHSGLTASAALSIDFDEVLVRAAGTTAHAEGLRLARDSAGLSAHVDRFDASIGPLSSTGHNLELALAPEGTLLRARSEEMKLSWTRAVSAPTAESLAATSPVEPGPVVDPVIEPHPRSKQHKGVSADPVSLPQILPDLHALRAAASAAIASAGSRIPEGAGLAVDALAVQVVEGEERLTLGLGSLAIDRSKAAISVLFSTSPLAKATPLALKAVLPVASGDLELSVSGGPVPLGLLGMRDGGLLHLLDSDRASFAGRGRVVLDETGSSLTFDVEGRARNLSLNDPRLANAPIRGVDVGVEVRGVIDDSRAVRIDEAQVSVGAARAALHGGFHQSTDGQMTAAFELEVPTASCQSFLSSVPSALVPTLEGTRLDGTFGLQGRLAFDTRDLDALAFDFNVKDHCRFAEVPATLEKARFASTFTHAVYSRTGAIVEEETGPGSTNWTELEDISPYMSVAVLTTEDGAFFHHHGFSHAAIRRALVANIKAHRFIRGASTITMQLAKNLFLSREKTLARKLEELALADYLEQTFSKEQMLELYLNVIEFGPDIYGVTAAAEHYFARRPDELNLAECMFLASILPNPIGFHKAYDEPKLGEGWLRTIRTRMQVAAHNGLISQAELAEGLTEDVVFHHDTAPRPAPRPPRSSPSHAGRGADWEEAN